MWFPYLFFVCVEFSFLFCFFFPFLPLLIDNWLWIAWVLLVGYLVTISMCCMFVAWKQLFLITVLVHVVWKQFVCFLITVCFGSIWYCVFVSLCCFFGMFVLLFDCSCVLDDSKLCFVDNNLCIVWMIALFLSVVEFEVCKRFNALSWCLLGELCVWKWWSFCWYQFMNCLCVLLSFFFREWSNPPSLAKIGQLLK